jgi:CBS domain-containing protein
VYAVEDAFARLPIHWMWWPALGAVAVGCIGFLAPRTLGVGYDNIEDIVGGAIVGPALLVLCGLKLVSWTIALGSGTSGGTLAPLLTVGAGLGAALASVASGFVPGIDPRMAALVGMAALFAGASRAFLASVVFAFESTHQATGLLPLLGGCAPAFLVSCLLMRDSIMTEKLARRGARVPVEYAVDWLERVLVRQVAVQPVVTLSAYETLASVRDRMAAGERGLTHQGYPIVDATGAPLGVLTRRDLLDPQAAPERRLGDLITRPLAVAWADNSLREAADHMVGENVGRLPVFERGAPGRIVGILTRSDLLAAHRRRLEEAHRPERTLKRRRPTARKSTASGS